MLTYVLLFTRGYAPLLSIEFFFLFGERSFFSKGDFSQEGDGTLPQSGPMRSYIEKENHIGLVVTEIIRYR